LVCQKQKAQVVVVGKIERTMALCHLDDSETRVKRMFFGFLNRPIVI
jgi:hypothetical protein